MDSIYREVDEEEEVEAGSREQAHFRVMRTFPEERVREELEKVWLSISSTHSAVRRGG